jgi:RHS repeat-associated protein
MAERNSSGTIDQFIYAPTGEKFAYMQGQTFVQAFIPLPGNGTALYFAGTGLFYRHPDWLGSARIVSSPSRAVNSVTAYAPFGETYASAGGGDVNFTGQESINGAGLFDFPAREYANQGRFSSPDPAGLATVNPSNPQSWNRYAYVFNNPLAYIDPFGLGNCKPNDPNPQCHGVHCLNPMAGCVGTPGFCGISGYCDNNNPGNPNAVNCTSFGVTTSCSSVFSGGGPSSGSIPIWVASDCVTSAAGQTCEPGYFQTVDIGAPTLPTTSSITTGFSIFGNSKDPRPSCFAGFVKDTLVNFFGYSGADIAGGVATAKYITTIPAAVPRNLAGRGGLTTRAWVRAEQLSRARTAAVTGLLVNLIVAEGQALASEYNSASNGTCK